MEGEHFEGEGASWWGAFGGVGGFALMVVAAFGLAGVAAASADPVDHGGDAR